MKKIIVSALLVIGFTVYALVQRFGDSDDKHIVVAPASQSQTNIASTPSSSPATSVATQTPAPINSPKPIPTPTPVAALYKDGQYTGPVTDAFYGNVEIKATIQSGKLTNVEFLQYPNEQGTSREINGQAMPYLKAEAIQAQSANVDVVSGATQTSGAFIKSLGAALAQAKS